MQKVWKPALFLMFLGGCGFVDRYEEGVHDFEPIYCYKSLAGVECYREPRHDDKLRLVNYYGPHPSRFDEPDRPDPPKLKAPEEIDYWVKDPEPIPKARPLAEAKHEAAQPE